MLDEAKVRDACERCKLKDMKTYGGSPHTHGCEVLKMLEPEYQLSAVVQKYAQGWKMYVVLGERDHRGLHKNVGWVMVNESGKRIYSPPPHFASWAIPIRHQDGTVKFTDGIELQGSVGLGWISTIDTLLEKEA